MRPDKEGVHRRVYDKNKARILKTQEVCGICGKPVDKSLRFPHPLSPVVDHIIPINRGGHPSDIDNLQLAHMTCNRAKSDKLFLGAGGDGKIELGALSKTLKRGGDVVNEQNLKPIDSVEKAREMGRKGGIASGKSKRRKKALREIAQAMGSAEVDVKKTADKLKKIGMDNSYDSAVVLALYQRAMKGDVRAIEVLAGMLGQSLVPQYEEDNRKADTALKKAHKEAITGEGTSGEALKRLDDILKGLKEDALDTER